MLGRFLLRLILVPLGGAVAVTVGIAVIVIAHWHAIQTLLDADPQAQGDYLFAVVNAGALLVTLLSIWAAYVLTAAIAGVLIAEALAVRSWIYHAANGGLAAWLGYTLTQDIRDRYDLLADPQVLVAAGLAAGLAYWLIAGSTAGFWKPVWPPRSPKPSIPPPPSRHSLPPPPPSPPSPPLPSPPPQP
jgi:hypothetical protein